MYVLIILAYEIFINWLRKLCSPALKYIDNFLVIVLVNFGLNVIVEL